MKIGDVMSHMKAKRKTFMWGVREGKDNEKKQD